MPAGRGEYIGRKLQNFLDLSQSDRRALQVLGSPPQEVPAHVRLRSAFDEHAGAFLFQDGWGMSFRILADGRRQIINLLLPGDFCDAAFFVLRYADYSIETITPCAISTVMTEEMLDLIRDHPRVGAALWWNAALEETLLRGHITALGRQTAYERAAYLICETKRRLQRIGLAGDDAFEWPITYEMLADALGLSAVHVSRTLRRLESDGLVSLQPRRVLINDLPGLQKIAESMDHEIEPYWAPAPLESYIQRL